MLENTHYVAQHEAFMRRREERACQLQGMRLPVHGCVCTSEGGTGRKIEDVSAARRRRAAAALIREGEDGPSVSVDSGLDGRAGQLDAACDTQPRFPVRVIFSGSRNQFIHLFTYRLVLMCQRGIPAEHHACRHTCGLWLVLYHEGTW